MMTGSEVLQSAQFVTVHGKRLVVLDANQWEALVEWLETLEDQQTVTQALSQLQQADGDRLKAGWLRWDEVKPESPE